MEAIPYLIIRCVKIISLTAVCVIHQVPSFKKLFLKKEYIRNTKAKSFRQWIARVSTVCVCAFLSVYLCVSHFHSSIKEKYFFLAYLSEHGNWGFLPGCQDSESPTRVVWDIPVLKIETNLRFETITCESEWLFFLTWRLTWSKKPWFGFSFKLHLCE